jgi:hypothetical protein
MDPKVEKALRLAAGQMGLNPEALVEVVGGYLPKPKAEAPPAPGAKTDALRAALQPEAMVELVTADGPKRGRK